MPKEKPADPNWLKKQKADIPAIHAAFKNPRLVLKLHEIQQEYLTTKGIYATWEVTDDHSLIVRVKPRDDDERTVVDTNNFTGGIVDPTIENHDYLRDLDIDTRARTQAFFSVIANIVVNVGYLGFGVTELNWKDQYTRSYSQIKRMYEELEQGNSG